MFQILISLLALSSLEAKAQDFYTVSVEDVANRKVRVNAKLFPKSDTLLMSPYGATHLKYGWATFLNDLVVTNSEGKRVEVNRMDNGVFVLAHHPKNKQINLSYNVNIHHDQGKWPFGYKEAAYVNNEMLMATGNALFITRLDVDSAIVNFQLKKPYKVANAWKQIAPYTFVAKGAEELIWTVLAIGNFNLTEIETGNTTLLLAYSDDLSASKRIIESTIKEAVKKYEAIYGGPPSNQASPQSKYLYVINVDTSYVGGGAAFTNSISILLNKKPTSANEVGTTSWNHILIHEIGHLWLGAGSLKGDERTEWFTEGFTDYIAYKVEYELGLSRKDEWEEMLLQKQASYSRAREKTKISLTNAGYEKGSNYDIIYSGGLLLANKLDTEIKKATENRKDITDFLRNMYAAFSSGAKPIENEDIKRVAEETCSCNLESLFLDVTDEN